MENHNEARKPADATAKDKNDKTLASDAEAAAAKEEPMGSIAAAVPGDDEAAEDGLEPGRKPGAEEPAIRKETGPTAGTEFPAARDGSIEDKNAA
jgi:hypothetical protein